MAVAWTRHRFSGGVLALDVANTVVHRGDPQKCFDRFECAEEIARFAEAASVFRAAEVGGRQLHVEAADVSKPLVIELREATDRLFRAAALTGHLAAGPLVPLLRACAEGLEGCDIEVGAAPMPSESSSEPLPFTAALALSALSLIRADASARIRICRNCHWLFLDRSRNGSRVWCDMAVCGNRTKARRHYNRRKGS